MLACELQFRPDVRIPKRLRGYAALGEEKYNLLVYPVVINILPPASGVQIATSYHSEFMGITAHQDFRVINLWEVDAQVVFEQKLTTLLPFVPILRGGQTEKSVSKAVIELRAAAELSELEPLLAFFATFVLQTDVVQRIMRWDMTILRESPWYNEILQEGIEQGVQKGIEQGVQKGTHSNQVKTILHVARHRFGQLPAELELKVSTLSLEQLLQLIDVALDAQSLAEVIHFVQHLPKQQGNV